MMKSGLYFLFIVLATGLFWGLNTAIPVNAGDSDADVAKRPAVNYTPPFRGAPGGRVGAGSRGDCQHFSTPSLFTVILPDHVAFTSSPHPSLYWYINEPTTATVEVTLIEMTAIDPLLEVALDVKGKKGFQRLALAKHGVRLASGKQYQWSMSIICDQKSRANNSVVSGHIQFVPTSQALSTSLAGASDIIEQADIYGENGYWIDMFDALNTAIKQLPRNKALLNQRIKLVRMIDLPEVASLETTRMSD